MSEQLEKILIGFPGNIFVQKIVIRETKATWWFWGGIPDKCRKPQRTYCEITCQMVDLSAGYEKLRI
jgi:hypothetical protein